MIKIRANARRKYGLGLITASTLVLAGIALALPSPPSLQVNRPETSGGASVRVTVTLSEPAPPGGITLPLASDNAALTVPTQLVIPFGGFAGTFTATTSPVTDLTRVKVSVGTGTDTATTHIIVVPIPTAADVTVTPTATTATVKWAFDGVADSFLIERSDDGGANFSTIRTTTDLEITDDYLTPATTYIYRVFAIAGTTRSAPSESVSTTLLPALSVPTLTMGQVKTTSVALSWTTAELADPLGSPFSIRYRLQRSADGKTGWANIYDGPLTTFTHTGLTENTSTFYRVQAYTWTDTGAFSAEVGTSTISLEALPIALPVDVEVLESESGVGPLVRLRWLPSDRATGYDVQRSLTPGGPYTSVSQVTVTEFIGLEDPNLHGTLQYYVVIPTNSFGAGPVSNEVSVRTNTPRTKNPVGPLVIQSDGTIYGVNRNGGINDTGGVYRFRLGTEFSELLSCPPIASPAPNAPGSIPNAGIVSMGGNLFCVPTSAGGEFGKGTLWLFEIGGFLPLNRPHRSLTNNVTGLIYDASAMDVIATQTVSGGVEITAGNGSILSTKKNDLAVSWRTNFPGMGESFDQNATGGEPSGRLLKASDGAYYGVTGSGGSGGTGTVYRLNGSIITAIHSFHSWTLPLDTMGRYPSGGLVEVPNGTFYGVTREGGLGDAGTIFKVTGAGTFTTLYNFPGLDTQGNYPQGYRPSYGLTLGNDGNLYGSTDNGGLNDEGVVFRMTSTGTFTVLHHFDSDTGSFPSGELVKGPDGNLYGVCSSGGKNGFGNIFRIKTGGVFEVIHDF